MKLEIELNSRDFAILEALTAEGNAWGGAGSFAASASETAAMILCDSLSEKAELWRQQVMKQPKHILAEHAGRECVIRTQDPFIVGELYPASGGQFSFDLWPQESVASLDEAQIDMITTSMARFYWYVKRVVD